MKRLILLLLLWTAVTAAPAAAEERPVTLRRDFGVLYGTLLVPEGGSGVVALVIAGSGPTDRDGNNPLGVRCDAYRLLAGALADAGIASLRYDKRAIGASRYEDPGAVAEVTIDDFVDDVVALAGWLAAEGFAKVVLIGHSEGSRIALAAAGRSEHVAGVVSLCGAGYPMNEILRLQLARQLALTDMPLLVEAEGIIASLKRGERVDMTYHHPGLAALFNDSVQPFLISSFRDDPRDLARRLAVPLLVIGGTNDLQVPSDNADALAAAQPRARKVLVDGMAHTLKRSDATTLDEQIPTVYADPSLPLADGLADTVVGFIRGL